MSKAREILDRISEAEEMPSKVLTLAKQFVSDYFDMSGDPEVEKTKGGEYEIFIEFEDDEGELDSLGATVGWRGGKLYISADGEKGIKKEAAKFFKKHKIEVV